MNKKTIHPIDKILNNLKIEDYILVAFMIFNNKGENHNEIRNIILNIENLEKLKTKTIYEINKNYYHLYIDEFKNDINCFTDNTFSADDLRKIKAKKRLFYFFINSILHEIEFTTWYNFKDEYVFLAYIINIELIIKYKEKNGKYLSADYSHRILDLIPRKYLDLLNEKETINTYKNNEDFLIWSYKYLDKKIKSELKSKNITDIHPKITPLNKSEYKLVINSALDLLFYIDKKIYIKTVKSLKKAWQQKCFRDNKGVKKPYHLPLTKQAKSELGKLSDFKDQSENKILEDLIHQMYLKEMYDENGKPRY